MKTQVNPLNTAGGLDRSWYLERISACLLRKTRFDPLKPVHAARLSFGVGLLVLALKYLAYYWTGSVSLYSDALESIVNVVASGAALIAVHYAARPPDANHPYGHTKAEYFSVVLEGALILFASYEIVQAAWVRLKEPQPLDGLSMGLAVSLLATTINGILAAYLVRTGRRQRSPAIVADGRHLWTDVFTTVGVLAGVSIAWVSNWWILDPLVAILVALNIIRVGWQLVRESVGGLMDESLSDLQMEDVQQVLNEHMGDAIEVHALRSRHAGRETFIDFHLVVPDTMTVAESHAICDRLEMALHQRLPESVVTIHVEPEHKAKHLGRVVRLGIY